MTKMANMFRKMKQARSGFHINFFRDKAIRESIFSIHLGELLFLNHENYQESAHCGKDFLVINFMLLSLACGNCMGIKSFN